MNWSLAGLAIAPFAAGMTACGSGTTTVSNPTIGPRDILVLITTHSMGVATLQTKTFTATVSNDTGGQGVTWQVFGEGCSGLTCGTLVNATSSSVDYSAPSTTPIPAFVTVTATSAADHSKSDSAKVTLFYPGQITIMVDPDSQSISTGGKGAFAATVSNDPADAGATWRIECDTLSNALGLCGAVVPATTANGAPTTYRAPPILFGISSVGLRATSQTDPTAYATATVKLTCSVPADCVP
jgi:trimeric autotransporter adhesin